MVEEKRSLGVFILLDIITCGFYSWYFYYTLARDMNTVCDGDGEETPGLGYFLLFSFLTCGIYGLYCYYKIGNRQAANAARYNVNIQENGTAVLVWYILGMWIVVGPFVATYILIKNMNMLAHAYNTGHGYNQQYGGGNPNNYGGNPNNYDGGQNNYGGAPNNNYAGTQNNYAGTQNGYGGAPATVAMTQDSAAGLIYISCLKGEFAGNDFPLNVGESIIIGRDNSCNIRFDSNTPNLSRRHCAIYYDGNNVWLTDIGSTFGTYLTDGTRLVQGQRTPLQPGMGFYLGSEAISFCRR